MKGAIVNITLLAPKSVGHLDCMNVVCGCDDGARSTERHKVLCQMILCHNQLCCIRICLTSLLNTTERDWKVRTSWLVRNLVVLNWSWNDECGNTLIQMGLLLNDLPLPFRFTGPITQS